MQTNSLLKKLSGLLLILLFVAYARHFDNAFHFDDIHTIQNNSYIQDLRNIPAFFIDGAETFSSLPENQLYRPLVSTSIAIDFWISETFFPEGGGFDTRPYHWSMFAEYLLLLLLMFFFFRKIFEKAGEHPANALFALLATGWFGLHTVNAETLNYIISRSDLLSTLFVVASFVWYQYDPARRRYGFFLIPFVLGVFTKLTAAMFIPLLVVYYAIFELPDVLEKKQGAAERKHHFRKLTLQALALLLVFVGGIWLVISQQADTYTTGGSDRWAYLITQPFVVLHYFISFFYPYLLSADTDWDLIPINDIRFFAGMAFVFAMLFIAWKTGFKQRLRPIAFGILWFFIALAPTSSVIPLAEVMNDHRMLFPFVGLALAVVWSLKLLYERYEQQIRQSFVLKNVLVLGIAVVMSGHVLGTMERVRVWDNGESLWYDVTVKSPKNGRGLMNYGLRKMRKGDYEGAMEYFNRALQYSPYYSYLYTNMAIAKDAMGVKDTAELYHIRAIELAPSLHQSYYYYGNFLKSQNRYEEAMANYRKANQLAPQFVFTRYGLMEVYMELQLWDELKQFANESYQMFPKDQVMARYVELSQEKQASFNISDFSSVQDIDLLLNLSLSFYKARDFVKVVVACERILEIEPDNTMALNNLCSAYNELKQFDLAVKAGKRALSIQPDYKLAANNLAVAERRLALRQRLQERMKTADWIDLSVVYYNEEMYQDCIQASEKALEQDPANKFAYNNICSAYNALGEYGLAAEACYKALEIDEGFEHARNNLKHAEAKLKSARQ